MQKPITPGTIFTLPSGNVVRAGSTLNGVVQCRYINTAMFAQQVDFSVGWLATLEQVK